MLTDVHTHAFRPAIAHKVLEFLHGHYGIQPVGDGLIGDLTARLEKAGIERCVVHTAAVTPDQVKPANAWAAELQRTCPQVVAFGSVHPDFPEWEKEMDRLEKKGFRGLKLHPDFQNARLDSPGMLRIFEAARGRFTLMVHVGDRPKPSENPSCPMKIMRIKKNFPGLDIIAAHLGGYLHWKWARECLIGEDIFIDTSSSLPFMDDETLFDIFRRHPRELILFGSDYPLFDPGDEAERLKTRLSLTSRELAELMENADRLLGAA
jgi:hypothetical protein